MIRPQVNVKKLLAPDGRRVEEIVTELEASVETTGSVTLWTERVLPSTKGGKMGGA